MATSKHRLLESWSPEKSAEDKNPWLFRSAKIFPSLFGSQRGAPPGARAAPSNASQSSRARGSRGLGHPRDCDRDRSPKSKKRADECSLRSKSYFRSQQHLSLPNNNETPGRRLARSNSSASAKKKSRSRPQESASATKAMQPSAATSGASAAEESPQIQVEVRTEAFQATLLWERIVSHMEHKIKSGRHSYGLRSYENCFPGHKVVECLMNYLTSVIPRTVKKSQARLLGQKLMLTGVIIDARNKDKTVFRESRLYRFTGNHFWAPSCDSRGGYRYSRAQEQAEGGIHKSHSTEHLHGAPPPREQKHKSSGRSKGYMSDSTLASSSLSHRVVQVKSTRGRPSQKSGGDKHGKSQLTCSLSAVPQSQGTASSSSHHQHHYQHRSSQKTRGSWFSSRSSESTTKDKRAKFRTSTIIEEPPQIKTLSAIGATMGADSASENEVIEPTAEPHTPHPIPQDSPLSPKHTHTTVFTSPSTSAKLEPQETVLRPRESLASQRQDIRHRILPTRSSTSKQCIQSFSDSASNCSSEQSKGWVVYGFV